MWDLFSMPRVVAELDGREGELADLQGVRARCDDLEAENAVLRARLGDVS